MSNLDRNALFAKLVGESKNIINFLENTQFRNTATFQFINQSINARKGELQEDNSPLRIDPINNSDIIEFLKEQHKLNIDDEIIIEYPKKDLLSFYNDTSGQSPYWMAHNSLGLLLQIPYSIRGYFEFGNINEERLRNTLVFFAYMIDEKYIKYFCDMQAFDEENQDAQIQFENLIRTDAIPQVLYQWMLDLGYQPNDDQRPNGNDASHYITSLSNILNNDSSVKFLRNLKQLRNLSGPHFLYQIVPPEHRKNIIKEALYTYIGVAYRILEVMGKIDTDPTEGRCLFTLHYQINEQNKRPYIYIDNNTVIEPLEDTETSRTYELYRNTNYKLQYWAGQKEIDIEFLVLPCAGCRFINNSPQFYGVEPGDFKTQSFIERKLGEICENTGKIRENTDKIVESTEKTADFTEKIFEVQTKQTKEHKKQTEEEKKQTEEEKKQTEDEKKQTEEEKKQTEEEIKQTNWLKFIASFLVITFIIGVVLYFVKTAQSPTLSPVEYVRKGDENLRKMLENHNLDIAPVTSYRKAIQMYEDTLKKDPSNVEAHKALALMYVRGKGYYDINSALLHAKNISHTDEGNGLYAYLLTRADSLDKARLLTEKAYDNNTNYMKLAKAVLTLYGSNELTRKKRTKESVQRALDSLRQIPCKEARLEEFNLTLFGIRDEKDEDEYLVNPQPIESYYALESLAVDSLLPVTFANLMDFHQSMENPAASLDCGYIALSCGIRQVAPLIKMAINNYADLEDEGTQETIRKIAELSGLIENSATLAHDINKILSAKKLDKQQHLDALMLVDSLITKLEKHDTNGYKFYNIKSLYKNRVRLCLITGDSIRAVTLALANSNSKDSASMMLYLRGVKAVIDNPKDTVYSDSLINLAAKRGLADAIYTRLRRTPPIQYKANTTTSIKKEHNHEVTEFSTNGFEMEYSPNAIIEDSIWNEHPMLATALTDYWKHDYGRQKRYINYCAKEYKDFWNVFYSIYYPTIIGEDKDGHFVQDVEPDDDEYDQIFFVETDRMPGKWRRIEELSQDKFTKLLMLIDRGIAHSLEANNVFMSHYFCAVKMIITDIYGPKHLMKPQGDDIWQKYRPFIPEEWVLEDGNVRIQMPLAFNLPVYIY